MARKDDILKGFLEHKLLVEKYAIDSNKMPHSIVQGLNSSIPIVKTIALIVDNLEASQPVTDSLLRNIITQYLNEAAI